MIIREAKPNDSAAIARIAQEVYKATFTGLSKEEMEAALKMRDEAYFSQVIPTDLILVAIEDTRIMGFIQIGPVTYESVKATDRDVELNKIYIDLHSQGKGIGNALMSNMLDHPRLKDIEHIYLDVFDKNPKAIHLYEKFGFKVIGRVPFSLKGEIVGHDLLMKYSK
jgi:ribosomal protein S18 acetylase RimI-like enzyme